MAGRAAAGGGEIGVAGGDEREEADLSGGAEGLEGFANGFPLGGKGGHVGRIIASRGGAVKEGREFKVQNSKLKTPQPPAALIARHLILNFEL